MQAETSAYFLVPISLGSCVLLYLSAASDVFKDNGTHLWPISLHLLISFTYFTYDFYLMACSYQPKHKIYFLHHLLAITCIPIVYFYYYFLIKYLLAFLTYELSTPFLNISLSYHERKIVNIWAKLSQLAFLLSYTIVRVFFGSYLVYRTVLTVYDLEYPGYLLVLFPLSLQTLIIYWYYKIIQMLRKKWFRESKKLA